MADAAAKRKRTTSLGKFTRNLNTLNNMLDNASPKCIVTPQFEKLCNCWNMLEDAHDAFIEITDIDIETDKDGIEYLDKHNDSFNKTVNRYSEYLKTSEQVDRAELHRKETADREAAEENRKRIEAEEKEAEDKLKKEQLNLKFESCKAELVARVDTFKRLVSSVKDSVVDGSASDKRLEWEKIEVEFKLLKDLLIQLSGIDYTKDVTEVTTKFVDDAEAVYVDFHKMILKDLKDFATSGGSSSPKHSVTKKEPIHLPSFQGDEKTSPFLKFPVWKKQWDEMILEYEEKYRVGLLWEHLDDAARTKFVGHETDYNEAIKRLSRFYGDNLKVVQCIMREVSSQSPISEGDYTELIKYCGILENNFTRLKNMRLEHEMSNMRSMAAIVQKLPRVVGEKWHEHLISKPSDERVRPFPIFIEWLQMQKEMWECMVSSGVGGKKQRQMSFFVGDEVPRDTRRCHGCQEIGHIERQCPKRGNKDGKSLPRKPPKVKKFWCALHKGENDRKCFSNSCSALRTMTDIQKRISLMKENGDCIHCCGDHKADDCNKKDRVCGGGKEGRGCIKNHNVHELFCKESKVVQGFSVQEKLTVEDDGVVLCIMKVCAPKGINAHVFWDSGCTSNFVREEFADLCGFKGCPETLSVTTLGGVVTEYLTVTSYDCALKDENGDVVKFKAYGLENLTGMVSKIPSTVLRKLFPHVSSKLIQDLERGSRVDVLIGLLHPSWHPERAERARGGGDLWIYRGRFGACVGGRHPEIKEATRRSDSLFSINHTYFVEASVQSFSSHALEYCPTRSRGVYNSSVKLLLANLKKKDDQVTSCGLADSTKLEGRLSNLVPDQSSAVCSSVREPTDIMKTDTDVISSLSKMDDTSNEHKRKGLCSEVMLESTLNCYACPWIPGIMWDDASSRFPGKAPISCGVALTFPLAENLFFQTETLASVVEPKCGGCRCSKCPVPGSRYS